ncbi:MAG: DNA-protecting protein DprA [Bacteroidia bacterium]|nr:DNA-protecting protein DprA [Bacteroidia bacterium]MCZ2248689.1 DNA-processing protein DprA [Bacteroidia bacterium]
MSNDLLYKIGITLLEGVGDINAKKLIASCGSAEAVFKAKKEHLLKIEGIGEYIAQSVVKQKVLQRAETEIKFITNNKIRPVFYLDNEYPQRLKQCTDAPVMLYYKGNANLNNRKILSIVGTRKATEYGKQFCAKLITELKQFNPLIVSGLAYGIDICAHKESLKNDIETVAVVAHGLDMIYPGQHKATSEKMIKQGGILTDFISGTKPDRENFPKRNRIVAGMCDAVIVVEAGITGGALITAEIANSYSRDVFALPGRVGDEFSAGCNKLIKINKAALIESVDDIVYLLGWLQEDIKASRQTKLFVELSDEEQTLVDYLKDKGTLPIDELCYATNIPMSRAASLLLNLEFNGVIKSLPGKMYQLN